MNTVQSISFKYKMLLPLACLIVFCCIGSLACAQIVSVNTVRNLSFGAFSRGATGGTLTISNTGMRSTTGDVAPLNLGVSYFQAQFEIESASGTIISIMNGSDAILTGSNGGTMVLHIGASDPASPFISAAAPPLKTVVNIGGTLTVGNLAQSPPGSYTGSFSITFNNE